MIRWAVIYFVTEQGGIHEWCLKNLEFFWPPGPHSSVTQKCVFFLQLHTWCYKSDNPLPPRVRRHLWMPPKTQAFGHNCLNVFVKYKTLCLSAHYTLCQNIFLAIYIFFEFVRPANLYDFFNFCHFSMQRCCFACMGAINHSKLWNNIFHRTTRVNPIKPFWHK